ncbi:MULTISPECIES: glycine zipper 2TM domain-containing protein [unclassified Janthinobacterium]|uniref:glycine zipper 2TM domain-containing protein n=1 Tax=unclassified Janthinobacterium TaxID=2610881 RepID=UPI001E63C55E|nr:MULTISPECIES: glycine zipper 2TM domain-containing protein [unclassified Janthinobacterium]MCC7641549.1 glycine zipper 2TM domain-containing protein [Janthinobacterium sp. EB271-G4-3-1]MCC7690802.1 glycine zipper 2TM domain-containing protein [Janthinobacterium sp. EB271-G4-3-2]
MIRRPLILAVAVTALFSTSAFAQNLSPKAQYAYDTKQASTRYADDKKLCAEETSSKARMQCLRDAKGEYDQAIINAKAAQKAGNSYASQPSKQQHQICAECGKVLAVNVTEKAGEGGALGMIGGGVAGALLGRQVGGGRGKDLATLAGAAGGAYAGKQVEGHMKNAKTWTVTVQYETGAKADFAFDQDPGLAAGDLVRNSGNGIARR